MTADEYYLDALGILTQDWPKIKEKFDSMEAEIDRLRARNADLEEQLLTALGERRGQ